MNAATARVESLDLAGIQRVADALICHLPKQAVFGLVGTLGAGKTTLVRAVARAAGIDATDVTSPTFTLLQTHRGDVTLHHLDAYRIADEDEFLELGVDELFAEPASWSLVEWADRVAEVMPAETIWIEITIGQNDCRDLKFSVRDEGLADLICSAVAEFD